MEKKLHKVVLIDFEKQNYNIVEISESSLETLEFIRNYTYLFRDMAICVVDEDSDFDYSEEE